MALLGLRRGRAQSLLVSVPLASTLLGTAASPAVARRSLFTHEHTMLRSTLRRIIDEDINPHVDEWEEAGRFPAHALFKKLGQAGLLGVNKPEAYGGLGLDYSYALATALELGHIRCGAIPMAIGVQTDMATPALAKHGSHALREQFLRPSIAGDMVACLGVSEAGAGSDVAAITTVARKDGADYVINGGKFWTTNGAQADWMCLLANTGDGPMHANKSLICLPMKTKGVVVARTLDKLGMRASDTAQIFLEDVRVPQTYRIGDEGLGFKYQVGNPRGAAEREAGFGRPWWGKREEAKIGQTKRQ